IAAPPSNGCACSDCPHMKLNTLEKRYLCPKHEQPELVMDEELRLLAPAPTERMLATSEGARRRCLYAPHERAGPIWEPALCLSTGSEREQSRMSRSGPVLVEPLPPVPVSYAPPSGPVSESAVQPVNANGIAMSAPSIRSEVTNRFI